LTIGSRGDIQPYIALCQALKKNGHTCRIASHGEYKHWIECYGIEFDEIGGNPAELMKICVDYGMFTLAFIREGLRKFWGWLDNLLVSSYKACKGTNLLIESPLTIFGIHIAEALEIPYFRAPALITIDAKSVMGHSFSLLGYTHFWVSIIKNYPVFLISFNYIVLMFDDRFFFF
ncbi:hypothetical protein BY996DRAFT_4574132, partial [Phakopsora pachyrhizi]